MSLDKIEFAVIAFVMFMCALGGWVFAHSTISDECEKLGGFYVGNKVYSCSKETKIKDKEKTDAA